MVVLVHSSLSVIANTITELDLIRTFSPDMTKRRPPWSNGSITLRTVLSIEAFSQLTRVSRSWTRASAANRPSIAELACHAGRGAQALVGDHSHRGEHVLDPVAQLGMDQMLQFVGSLALLGNRSRTGRATSWHRCRLLERQFRQSFSVVSASWNGWFSSMISCCFSVLSTVLRCRASHRFPLAEVGSGAPYSLLSANLPQPPAMASL